MSSFSRKFLAFCGAAALLFIAVISGGCGGSSSSLFPVDDVIDADTTLAGVWRIDTSATNNFASADIDGTEVKLSIKDFILRFQSVDVEGSNGQLYLDVIAILSSDRVIIPVAFDESQASTEYLSSNMWSMNIYGDSYLFELDGTESNPSLTLIGGVNIFSSYKALVGVTFKKIGPASSKSYAEMDNLLNGTWQTPSNLNGMINGGFSFMSADMPMPSNDSNMPEPPERPGDMPLINGMREIDIAFTNMIFEETDTANNYSILTTQMAYGTLTASNDFTGPVNPIMNLDYKDAKITALYDNIYKIEISSRDKSVLLVNSDNKHAYLVNAAMTITENGGYNETRTALALEKKPDASESTFNIIDQIGSVWHTQNLAVGEIHDPSAGRPINIKFEELGLMFPAESADIANRSLTIIILGRYYENTPISQDRVYHDVSFDINATYVERIGYNTWYIDNGDETTEGSSRAIITVLDNYALMTAHVTVNNKEVDIIAFLSDLGDIEDVFFSGAWTCASSDAKVNIVNPGFSGEVTLLTFGAYFSSVDIDSGTANFSAFTVLSSDSFLIPVVFDNEKVTVKEGATSYDFVVNSTHGSFTVNGVNNDPNKIKIDGKFNFQDMALTVSVDAVASRIPPTSQTLDFNTIMNHSTWQSTPFDAKSGGFAVIGNSSGAMIYPGINSKTFANIVFDGNNTGGEISGFGTMGLASFDVGTRTFVDYGSMLPVALMKEPIKVDNIFGNYYKFAFESGDSELKGVFILESESAARMILLADSGNSQAITRLHTVYYLHKVTETTPIDLTAFNNTSWDVPQAGGIVALQDGNILQITNSSPDMYSVRLRDFNVQFTNANVSAKTVDFKISAYIDIPRYGERATNQYIEFPVKTVTVEKLGAYVWYGEEGANKFIVTMSAGYQNRAALAGTLNFASPNNPNFNVQSSILLDLVLKQ